MARSTPTARTLRWRRPPIGASTAADRRFCTAALVCSSVALGSSFLYLCVLSFFFLMGWSPRYVDAVSSPSSGGYTVVINTWKRNSLLKQSVANYTSCRGIDAIHVVWSESDSPPASLKAYLKKIVLTKSQTAQKANFKFDINKEDNLNNRFKPIKDLRTDAIFSVDDDVVIPCHTLDFAFAVWQSAPLTRVGFVPRMHWLDQEVRSFNQQEILFYTFKGEFWKL